MHVKSWFFIVFITSVHAKEFFYPIAFFSYNQEPVVYFVHQKNKEQVELVTLNLNSHDFSSVFLSSEMPVGFSFFPDGTGFSFIDNGMIKIKLVNCRSSKLLRIYEPLHDFGLITWINSNCGYLHAKEEEQFGIYHITVKGDIERVLLVPDTDCMYPQKVNSTLFYIERTKKDKIPNYRIMTALYPDTLSCFDGDHDFNNTQQFDDVIAELLHSEGQRPHSLVKPEQRHEIISFGTQPIVFLKMISEQEGFVMAYQTLPDNNDKNDKVVPFTYFQIKKEDNSDNSWNYTELFTFSVPLSLISQGYEDCLCESLLPLLPRHIGNVIYFVDSTSYSRLSIFKYSLEKRQIILFSLPCFKSHFFAPLDMAGVILSGVGKN